jgi:hypothetical protein
VVVPIIPAAPKAQDYYYYYCSSDPAKQLHTQVLQVLHVVVRGNRVPSRAINFQHFILFADECGELDHLINFIASPKTGNIRS